LRTQQRTSTRIEYFNGFEKSFAGLSLKIETPHNSAFHGAVTEAMQKEPQAAGTRIAQNRGNHRRPMSSRTRRANAW
jgi:hypothetical protein